MLSVIIASFNGAKVLPSFLDGCTRLTEPRGGWRLIVVDNGSTDNTREVIENYASKLPVLYVHETRRGQNWARLAAMEHLEGDLIVFSDDDVTPGPDWLATHRDLADEQGGFDFFGGAIKPRWERPPEPWILEYVDLGACYSLTDPNWEEGPIAPNLVWSPNMSFRRHIFDRGFRFDTSVGPSGKSYAMGSETDFNVRLGEAGFKAWFSPRAVVDHFIRASQMERDWILGRAIRFGRGMHRRQLIREKAIPPLVFGIPRHLYRMIAKRAVSYGRAAVFGSDRARFEERWELNYLIGCARQAREHYAQVSGTAAAESISRTGK